MTSWGARTVLRPLVSMASRHGAAKLIHPSKSALSMIAVSDALPSYHHSMPSCVCPAVPLRQQGELILPSVANVITRPNIMIYPCSHDSGGHSSARRGTTVRALLLVHRMWQPRHPRRSHSCGDSVDGSQESIVGVELTDARRRWKGGVFHTSRTCGSFRSCVLSAYMQQRGFVALARTKTSVDRFLVDGRCTTDRADDGVGGGELSSDDFDQSLVIHDNHLLGFCLDKRAAPVYVHRISQLRRVKPAHLKTLNPHSSFISFQSYEWDTWREVCREPGWQLRLADESTIDGILRGTVSVQQLETCTHAIKLYT